MEKGPHIQQIEKEDGSVSFPTISYSFLAFFLGLNNTTGNGDADLDGSLPSLSFYTASNATPLDLSFSPRPARRIEKEDGQKTGIEDEGSGGGMHKSGVGDGDSPYAHRGFYLEVGQWYQVCAICVPGEEK